ncbi:hypothetical protein ATANTOWER_011667, partial [Ataeniobius toweri]|nr:hypothetical protein [Ataeniobius toweri]
MAATEQLNSYFTVEVASHLCQDSKFYDSLKCKVTERDTRTEHCISPRGSGNDATTQSTTMKRTATTTTSAMIKSTLAMRDIWTTSVKSTPLTYKNPPTQEDQSLWYVAVPVVLAALIIAVIAIIRWKKTKGNQGQIEERM